MPHHNLLLREDMLKNYNAVNTRNVSNERNEIAFQLKKEQNYWTFGININIHVVILSGVLNHPVFANAAKS